MIAAFQKDERLLSDIRSVRDRSGLHIWWLGQSGFLLQWQGKHLLFDPYLSDSLTKKYANTKKPHVRMSEQVINPVRLDFLDVVTSSHNHTDHLDAETLVPILANNPAVSFVIPEANRAFVCDRVQCAPDFPLGLTDGQSVETKGITITAVPASHNAIERDAQGRCKFLGYVVQVGPYTVYHSGDTIWYDGMVDLLAPFQVDVAFVPINGNDPKRGVAGNLNAWEAAQLSKRIGAKLAIPHHYDLFEFNTADPADFVKACEAWQQTHRVLRLGERVTV
jgi:L-ascorbate metabolism protein UlaG (beta-lactamase superfamily)